jgi:hypothetical protein
MGNNGIVARQAEAQAQAKNFLLEMDGLMEADLRRDGKSPHVVMCKIKNETAWVAGSPYFMTAFQERAFVFLTKKAAESFIEEFSVAIGPGAKTAEVLKA